MIPGYRRSQAPASTPVRDRPMDGAACRPLPKIIAFHLPQFHRIEENDRWWGTGFTDWTNVRKGRPLYAAHHQPRVPLDGNYYDLTEPSVRAWQATLARDHRVDGFCYYHYWFRGRKLLERPCEAILASGSPNFPFCFCWANEPWTRSWDGVAGDVLVQQDYGGEDEWRRHFEYLLPFFSDRRYLTHAGMPMFLIYRPRHFPGVARMIDRWQRWAADAGLPGVAFCKVLTAFDDRHGDPGFAASVSFEPWLTIRRRAPFAAQAGWLAERAMRAVLSACGLTRGYVWPYDSVWEHVIRRTYARDEFRGAFVGWDNTPRRGRHGRIVATATPEKFGACMRRQIAAAARDGSPFIFVNAWNEWAEGAVLEPDEHHRYAYLEQLRDAVEFCERRE